MRELDFNLEFSELNDWVKQNDFRSDDNRCQVLRNCFGGAFGPLAINEPTKTENNEYLQKVMKQARELRKSLSSLTLPNSGAPPRTALRLMGTAWDWDYEKLLAFVRELENVEESAKACMIEYANGAPIKVGKRRVIERALEFFLEYGNRKPTEEEGGAFATFCREFYFRATGINLTEDMDNGIRHVATKKRREGISGQIKGVIDDSRDKIDAKWGISPNRKLSASF